MKKIKFLTLSLVFALSASAEVRLWDSFALAGPGRLSPNSSAGEYEEGESLTARSNASVSGGDMVGFRSSLPWIGGGANAMITGGLSTPGLDSEGGAVAIGGGEPGMFVSIDRTFDPFPSEDDQLFFSVTMKATKADEEGVSLIALTNEGGYQRGEAILTNVGLIYYNGFAVGFVGDGRQMNLVVRYRSGNDVDQYLESVVKADVESGDVHTVVIRIDWNDPITQMGIRDPIAVWVDPDFKKPLGRPDYEGLGFLGSPEEITALHFLQSNYGDSDRDVVVFDEIRAGTDREDL